MSGGISIYNLPPPDTILTAEEANELMESMFAMLHEEDEAAGGVEKVIRAMRGEDEEEEDAVKLPEPRLSRCELFAYAFDAHPLFGRICLAIMAKAQPPEHEWLTSSFTLSEVLVKPVQLQQNFKVASIQIYFKSNKVTTASYPDAAIPFFVQLPAFQRVKPLDALHLACAAHAGTDLFQTNDAVSLRLQVSGIGRIAPLTTDF